MYKRQAYTSVSNEGQEIQIRFNDANELAKAKKLIGKNYADLTLTDTTLGEDKVLKITLSLVEQKALQDAAIKPVSYTHLDVYKRQVLDSLSVWNP